MGFRYIVASVGAWRVTFFALHWDVLPGKGIARSTVVELSDGYGLPIGVIVGIVGNPGLSGLCENSWWQVAQVGVCRETCGQILILMTARAAGGNALGGVAFVAGHALMFPSRT